MDTVLTIVVVLAGGALVISLAVFAGAARRFVSGETTDQVERLQRAVSRT